MLDEILAELDPQVLRTTIEIPHHQWRMEFEPRFVVTSSHEEMMRELGRFIAHMQERWFGSSLPWPPERAEVTLRRLLDRRIGNGLHPKAGEVAAMRICRHGENGGLRFLLDELTDALVDEALTQYLDYKVLPKIYRLNAGESLLLAGQFLAAHGTAVGMEVDSPASVALRWRQVIHQHAQAVLHAGASKAPW